MFSSLRRALVGLAVIASATVAVPVATSVVTASNGTIDNTTWSPTTGGLARFDPRFTENAVSVVFTAQVSAETSSGGLLLAGYIGNVNSDPEFALVRVTSSGEIDTTFDGNGLLVLDRGPGYGAADFIQRDGNDFIVGGWSGPMSNRRAAVVKIDASGVVTSWGSSGWAEAASADMRYRWGDLSFFMDNTQIVMWSQNSAGDTMTIHRFSVSTGQLMPGGGGISNPANIAFSVFGNSEQPHSFVMLGTNTMLVASTTRQANDTAELFKVDIGIPSPALDANYGNNGTLPTLVPSTELEDFRGSGSAWYLVGSSGSNPSTTGAVRIVGSGAVDLNWGANGYISTGSFTVSMGSFELDSSGNLLIAGRAPGGNDQIRRFIGSTGAVDTNFVNGGNTAGTVNASPDCNMGSYGWLVPIANGNFFQVGPKGFQVSGTFVNGFAAIKWSSSGNLQATACNGMPPSASISYGMVNFTGSTGSAVNIVAPTTSNFLGSPTFAVTNLFAALPGTLTLNPSNGAITGTPTASFTSTVQIEAVYTQGNLTQRATATISFNITAPVQNNPNPNQPPACTVGAPTVTGTQPVLDTSWGTSGWTTFQASGNNSFLYSTGMVRTSDNKFLLIGNGPGSGQSSAIDVRKFDADGTVVNAFGINGRLVIENNVNWSPSAITVDTTGRIYVLARETSGNQGSVYSIRLTSTGTLDTTYDTDGILPLSNLPGSSIGYSFVASASGDVYISSSTFANNTNTNYYTKFSATGRDNSFGTNGNLDVSSIGGNRAAVLADGSLLVAGNVSGQLKLTKYSSAGVIDSSWATSGTATFGNTSLSESAREVVVSGSDLFVTYMAFVSNQQGPPSMAAGVAKVSAATGVVDTTFGIGGGVYGPVRSGLSDPYRTIVLSDGSIVMAVFAGSFNAPTGGFLRFSSTGQFDGAFASSETIVKHGTCEVSPPSIVELSNGSVLFSGNKNQPNMNTPSTEVLVGKFTFGALTAGTPGGGFTGGGNQNPNNNQNPNPAPAPAPVVPPSTTVPPTDNDDDEPRVPGRPNLVTDENRPNLVRTPGQGGAVIDGEDRPLQTEVIDAPAAQVRPERRTPAQVNQLRQAANELVQQFTQQLPPGSDSTIQVVPTDTGAIIRGLVTDTNGNPIDVPAEDVVLMRAEELVVMVGAQSANVTPDGRFQVPVGSTFGLAGTGFGGEEMGEFVVMSTPTLITEFETTEVGTFDQTGRLPQSIGVGDHTLVVATGTMYAVLGIQVVPTTLPVTGSSNDTVLVFALFTMVFGALLVRSRRTLLV